MTEKGGSGLKARPAHFSGELLESYFCGKADLPFPARACDFSETIQCLDRSIGIPGS